MTTKANYILFAGITVTIILIIFYSFSDTRIDQNYVRKIRQYREKKDSNFRSDADSPIEASARQSFSGLHYFEPEVSYRINARLTPIPNDSVIVMSTSTSEKREYIRYAYADFVIDNISYRLVLLKSTGPGSQGALFLAFTDETNGAETYEAGRYIDIEPPAGNQVVIDFNMAYNPYCAYNKNYSCPLPPAENHLKTRILAGERKFH